VLHDWDSIYAASIDRAIASMGRHVLKPVRTPQANAFCERLFGTMHREWLGWLIPIHERHLVDPARMGHPLLGPRIPCALSERHDLVSTNHRFSEYTEVIANADSGGLHVA
jgi:hypothetical protein